MGNVENKPNDNKMSRKIKKYGWNPDIPDIRDIVQISISYSKTKKNIVDLRDTNFLPPVLNQGNMGSCVTHAVLAAFMFIWNKSKKPQFVPSRQFIYYNQRICSNTIEFDSGSSIRDALKIIKKFGVCKEECYPYDIEYFTDRPNINAYKNASTNMIDFKYKRIDFSIENIMNALNYEIPVIFGYTVFESFDNANVARTGLVPVPKITSEKIIGSCCSVIVGYDNTKKYFLCMGSWGTSFGQGGYFWVPYAFVNAKNCSDFWILYHDFKASEPIQSQPIQPIQPIQSQPTQLVQDKDSNYNDYKYKEEIYNSDLEDECSM